jgi:hypothetical protein
MIKMKTRPECCTLSDRLVFGGLPFRRTTPLECWVGLVDPQQLTPYRFDAYVTAPHCFIGALMLLDHLDIRLHHTVFVKLLA